MADRAMAWKERPIDFVSTLNATTACWSRVIFAFGLPDFEKMTNLSLDYL
jgi:hypothetical protein